MGFVCLVLIFSCDKSSSSSSQEDSSFSSTPATPVVSTFLTIKGVAATGVALANAEVALVDANDQVTQVTTTDLAGNFSFAVSDEQVFPVILSVEQETQTPLCSIIAARPNNTSEITVHLNPVTDLVCRSLLAENLPASLNIVASNGRVLTPVRRQGRFYSQKRALTEVTTEDFQSTGEQVVQKVFGKGLSFTIFNDDASFQARNTGDNTQDSLPSVSDVLLDAIQELASNDDTTLETFLTSELENANNTPLLDQDEFMVGLSSSLISVGYDAQTSSNNVEAVVNRSDVVDSVNTIAVQMEGVKQQAINQGISDQAELEIILKGVSTAIVEVIKTEKVTQNVSTLSEVHPQALANVTSNIIDSVQTSVIDLVKEKSSTLNDTESLNSLVKTSAKQVSQLTSQVSVTNLLDQETLQELQQASQTLIQTTGDYLSEAVGTAGTNINEVIQNSQAEILALADEKKQALGQALGNSDTTTVPTSTEATPGSGEPQTTTPVSTLLIDPDSVAVIPTSQQTTVVVQTTLPENPPRPPIPEESTPNSSTTSINNSTTGPETTSTLPTTTTDPTTSTIYTTTTTTTVPPIGVQILSPKTLLTVGHSPILVLGSVDDPDVELTVNGIPVPLLGTSFKAAVSLEEGANTIVARAFNANTEATASISVSLDKTPPYITIDSLVDGQVVTTPSVMLSGLVNDIVRGTVSEDQANVVIISEHLDPTSRKKKRLSSGISATVSNRSYLVQDVPLQAGTNLITVQAADQVGNVNSKQITVHYKIPQTNHLELISGQNQSGEIGTILPHPLKVKLVNKDGVALVGESVVFRVVQGDGIVGANSSQPSQAVLLSTDSQGEAFTFFKLGSRSGKGNQHVRVTGVNAEGEVLFYASAVPKVPEKISINSGNNQRGGVNQQLGQPFVVTVTDAGSNLLPGIEVTFEVTAGGGKLQNGQTAFTTPTDSDGRASAHLTVGPEIGLDNHRVTATIVGTGLYAGFTASALQTGDPGNTRISGLVLDNEDQPIPGVTVRVEGTTRRGVTDETGQFTIPAVPVGPLHLIADGSTTTRKGVWPTLSYNVITIPGADNPLPAPIYMLKLNTENAQLVGEADVEFTLPEVPGFKLMVPKGSVTFPDGSKAGYLSVTVVNSSKVPMPPPNGMQPQFIITIQPTGAMFDPPAPLTLPNIDGHVPGSQLELYSYDHDLEEFVTIGLGKVSEDGQVIESLPGVGVVKAGWHCGSQPTISGCVHRCNECQLCAGNCNCQPDPSKNGQDIGLYYMCSNGKKVRLSESKPSGLLKVGLLPSIQVKTAGKAILRAHWSQQDYTSLSNISQNVRQLNVNLKKLERELVRMNHMEIHTSNTRLSARQLQQIKESMAPRYTKAREKVIESLEQLKGNRDSLERRLKENRQIVSLRKLEKSFNKKQAPLEVTETMMRQLQTKTRALESDVLEALDGTNAQQLYQLHQLLEHLRAKPIIEDLSIIETPTSRRTLSAGEPQPPSPLPGPGGN